MSAESPVFILTTAGESDLILEPRACWFLDRLRNSQRDDYMLVHIDPPIHPRLADNVACPTTELLLATRHAGYTLFPVTLCPTHVYIAAILDNEVKGAKVLHAAQVSLLA